MRIIRQGDYRVMPWKNGGGETAEMLAWPENTALDAFDWRVSLARVGSSGPFSTFPEIDRTLAVLDGGGLLLAVAGRGAVRLTRETPPYPFPGDAAAAGTLLNGPVTDFNAMSRRGRFRHRMTRRPAEAPFVLECPGQLVLALLQGCGAALRAGAVAARASAGDAVVGDAGSGPIKVAPDGAATLMVVDLWRC